MVFQDTPNVFPPGRRPLPQDFLDRNKRERIALAVARIVREFGVSGLTVDLVIRDAKMARATFYDQFPNGGRAIEYANDLGNRKLIEAVNAAADTPGGWERRVEGMIDRLIEAVLSEPELSELCLVHGRGSGKCGGPVHPDLMQALAAILRPGRRERPKPPPAPRTEELIAYGIVAVISDHLRRGDLDELRGLGRDLTQLATLPFLGREAAFAAPARH